jgi:hypothetical protein
MEIVGLPVVGALAIEVLHTPKNELVMFFIPFLLAVLRLFIAQFQVPPRGPGNSDNPQTRRAFRACVACNQLAVFVLILFEAAVVMAGGRDVPAELWAVVISIFVLYITLRLLSRRQWIAAAAQST